MAVGWIRGAMPKNDPDSTATARVEQLRAKRRGLADRIQELLAELERAEHEYDVVSKELETLSKGLGSN
jgi:archaellum component FlaC